MNTKHEIAIKVPAEVAEAYRKATEEEQEQIQLKVAAILQAQLKIQRKEAAKRLRKTMDVISAEAQAKGLTPEILESILNDEE